MSKRVQFSPTVLFWPRRDERDSIACASKWLTEEDYGRIRCGIRKTVQTIRRDGNILDEDEMTLRGIEHLQSAEVLEQLVIDKDRATKAVFREQERQATAKAIDGDAIDAGRISSIYMAHSTVARQAALERAGLDEAFVQANREEDVASARATPQQQQVLDTMEQSLPIDSGNQADTAQLPTWLNHHDSLTLTGTEDSSHPSTQCRPNTGCTDLGTRTV
jgi:hypothetical protein